MGIELLSLSEHNSLRNSFSYRIIGKHPHRIMNVAWNGRFYVEMVEFTARVSVSFTREFVSG